MKDTIYREDAIKIVHHYFSELIDLLPTTQDSEGEELIIDTHKCKEYLMMNKVLSGLISELPSAEPKEELLHSFCYGCVNDNSDFTPICAECCRAYPDEFQRK